MQGINDISYGGLRFQAQNQLKVDALIDICLSVIEPAVRLSAKVVWCEEMGDHFDVGVEFVDKDDAYKARMVEQVCHIQHYRNEVLQHEGRELSREEAAREWINQFAKDFPGFE